MKNIRIRWIFGGMFILVGVMLLCIAKNHSDRLAEYIGTGIFCIAFGSGIIFVMNFINKKQDEKIEWVQIVDVTGKVPVGSSVVRGVVGGLIGGDIGAALGTATTKENKKTQFLIRYKNGKSKTVEVENNHPDYKRYIKLLK